MKKRVFTRSALEVSPRLVSHQLASPFRRIGAFALDCIVLFVPTVVVILAVAVIVLLLSDPDGLRGLLDLAIGEPDEETKLNALTDIAPLLVSIDAEGLPAAVKAAVEKSEYRRAGELLMPYEFDFAILIGGSPPPLAPDTIRVDIKRLIPNSIRGIAIFGVTVLYFTVLTARGRTGTLGKRLFRIRVVRLDDRPISYWESFERVGGYLASVGTFGIGLLDFWRDPNRRLAHDRIARTVVLRRTG